MGTYSSKFAGCMGVLGGRAEGPATGARIRAALRQPLRTDCSVSEKKMK